MFVVHFHNFFRRKVWREADISTHFFLQELAAVFISFPLSTRTTTTKQLSTSLTLAPPSLMQKCANGISMRRFLLVGTEKNYATRNTFWGLALRLSGKSLRKSRPLASFSRQTSVSNSSYCKYLLLAGGWSMSIRHPIRASRVLKSILKSLLSNQIQRQ